MKTYSTSSVIARLGEAISVGMRLLRRGLLAMTSQRSSKAGLMLALASPTLAFAHPGHELSQGFAAGLMHPLTGIDHLAAMLAVGMWAGQLGGRLRWALPLSFVSLMLVGAALGMQGWALTAVEQGIAASLVVFGVLIAMTAHLPLLLGVLITAAFAMFHGYAHGAEIPAQASAIHYMTGFAISTAVLHALGYALARMLIIKQQPQALRFGGVAIALCGVVSGAALLVA